MFDAGWAEKLLQKRSKSSSLSLFLFTEVGGCSFCFCHNDALFPDIFLMYEGICIRGGRSSGS